MRWIRRHIRSGAWLGLTALALHLILTFGHVHTEGFTPASMAATSVVAADAQAAGQALSEADGDGASDEHFRTLRAHHFCAICANISLLGTSVPPIALTLGAPLAVISVRKPDFAGITPPHELRSSSQARAPPAS